MEIDLGTRALTQDFRSEDQESIVQSLIKGFTEKMTEVFNGV